MTTATKAQAAQDELAKLLKEDAALHAKIRKGGQWNHGGGDSGVADGGVGGRQRVVTILITPYGRNAAAAREEAT